MIPAVAHLDPIESAFQRVRNSFGPKLAISSAEYEHFAGYMGAKDQTTLPHVLVGGVVWLPNVFLARMFFLQKNPDVSDSEMSKFTAMDRAVFRGVQFFRFRRV